MFQLVIIVNWTQYYNEKNVIIGDDCSLGSNNVIRNTLIKNNVKILDNYVIGKHGHGFLLKTKI